MVIREFVNEHNRKAVEWLHQDYEHLGKQLHRRGVEIEGLTGRAMAFRVAVPSWGVGTGGTRFARFAGPGEPRSVFEKLDDCDGIQQMVRVTPGISLHIPWDEPESADEFKAYAAARGLFFASRSSNDFWHGNRVRGVGNGAADRATGVVKDRRYRKGLIGRSGRTGRDDRRAVSDQPADTGRGGCALTVLRRRRTQTGMQFVTPGSMVAVV